MPPGPCRGRAASGPLAGFIQKLGARRWPRQPAAAGGLRSITLPLHEALAGHGFQHGNGRYGPGEDCGAAGGGFQPTVLSGRRGGGVLGDG